MVNHSLELFRRNFIDSWDGHVQTALYGLGKQTEEILTAFPDLQIVGLLDGYREDGEFCGKKVIPLAALAGRDVRIIILARKASEKIIYNRIRSFCAGQGIPVYNLEGILPGQAQDRESDCGSFRQEAEEAEKKDCFRRNLGELTDRIKDYDAISFDIFDTLLTRKTLQQEDVFSMVEAACGLFIGYARMRMRAELELSRYGAPTIFELYGWMEQQAVAAPGTLLQLLRMELETEMLVLEPRDVMVQLLKEAVSEGKHVYLVSDMYLPREIMEGLLVRNGIYGYEGLFISCDYGTNKAGSLYDIYKANSKGEKRLHIGDSAELDGQYAAAHGLDVYLIIPPKDMADLTLVGHTLSQTDEFRAFQGMLYARLFNDPFALYGSNGKLRAESPADLGYGILGPIMTGYVHWLYRKLLKEPLDIILFIARDGYLVKRIFDFLYPPKERRGLPKSFYLMTSRTLSVCASLETEDDIMYAAGLSFDGEPEDMLRRRFHLDEEELLPRVSGEQNRAYLMKHKDLILARAAWIRSDYQAYLAAFQLKGKKVGIFDFVSTGTCQMCLEKILGISMKGYYFERIEDSHKSRLEIDDFVHEYASDYESDNYFLLESWIKSTDPSVRRVTAEGGIVYCSRHNSEAQTAYIRQLQKGALRFCGDYAAMRKAGMDVGNIEKFSVHMLSFVNDNFIHMDSMQMENYDEFSNRKVEMHCRKTD